MQLTSLLLKTIELNGSDLFVSVDSPPAVKVEGDMILIGDRLLEHEDVREIVYEAMDDQQIKTYEEELEMNLAINLPEAGRFRLNIFNQRGHHAMVARYIKSDIPSIETLGLPEKLKDLICEERGLILVVGGTGTGKSTSLASMIGYRAKTQSGHVLTVEDPVEFVHSHNKALVNQREVGIDTHSYANALKNAMREAPDVILIGEIRDRETMQHALSYAETGHLCVSTLHANNANQTMDRILNFFPESAHNQVLMDLSLNLRAIVAQRLCRGVDGKRVAAIELMLNTPYISDLIQKGKIDSIKEAMSHSGVSTHQTFDDELYKLFDAGKISEEEAMLNADSKNNLALKIRMTQRSSKTADSKQEASAPLKKEVAFNKKAPFEQYMKFSLTPLKVSYERRDDALEIAQKAFRLAFEKKNMFYDEENPDIEIQFAFGLKSTGDLHLDEISNANDTILDIAPDTENRATLIVNIKDVKHNQDVWRVNATRRLKGGAMTSEQAAAHLEDVLVNYPPK